ncbi:IclR family transcriptional regulator [Parapedobacter sp. 10938]|uniref:IclR family transcriptional regulator n=1 Tax=Parapedobacter flavus TaxID=3110225 RepID=UPI002DB58BC8|nr:IclR family transcriptional regulator C-terminal domain-containing protein [Parapedobacter sp. 10938]MEC3879826.1 IclR family transcriptional regulator C-terminal domain-containing protein [Parapedobacter sp. 10938]
MIQVLNRALDILELLSRNLDKELSLSEIADPLNLNHSTCANIIKTMINRGYIEKQKGYRLGKQMYYLTNNFSVEKEIVDYAADAMKTLSDTLRESCILAVIKNHSRITLHKETFVRELQVNALDEKHAYLTATGRLLLAYMEPVERNAFIHIYGIPGTMWDKIDSERALILELQEINKAGFAVHHDESNIVGVAMPIFRKDEAIASLGIYLPENRYTEKTKGTIFRNLENTAKEISEKINFYN